MQMSVFKIAGVFLLGVFCSAAIDAEGSSPEESMERCSDQNVIYKVETGDNLYNISNSFGSYLFWESIYIANADKVKNPNLIYPGQEIKIPYNVANYAESGYTLARVLENPFCRIAELPYMKVEEKYLRRYSITSLKDVADAERDADVREQTAEAAERAKALEKEANNSKSAGEQYSEGEKQRETERQLMLEIDGMVHDETRSKVGRDFYDVFYSYWQSPPDAHNFTIKVSEQPSPNLGTTILVEVNYTETFKMRLQPRYEMIQEAGKFAVRQTYRHLQNNPQGTMIY